MGIKHGSVELVTAIEHGLYNRHAKVFDINVDGENLQYKGCVSSVTCQANAEALIASTAHEYLSKTIVSIEQWLGGNARNINIYMDGQRVENKDSRTKLTFDVRAIRAFFAYHCHQSNWTVIENGESELQMYLRRDRSVNLNVFVTNDTDMISICYGHEPLSTSSILNIESQDLMMTNGCTSANICDLNRIYSNDIETVPASSNVNTAHHVYDSCLWVNTKCQQLKLIGFDYVADKLNYDVQIFRVMIAMCGTDFTPGILTNTQIRALLLPSHENINRYTAAVGLSGASRPIHDIVVALLALSFRGGGLVNRAKYKADETVNLEKFIDAIRIYCHYVNTGCMVGTTERQNCGLVVRHYVYAMMAQQQAEFKTKSMRDWFTKSSIAIAINNFHRFMGSYNHNVDQKAITKNLRQPTARARHNQRLLQQHQEHEQNPDPTVAVAAIVNNPINDRMFGSVSSVQNFEASSHLYENAKAGIVDDLHNVEPMIFENFDNDLALMAYTEADALSAEQKPQNTLTEIDNDDNESLDLGPILDWVEEAHAREEAEAIVKIATNADESAPLAPMNNDRGVGIESPNFQSILAMLLKP